MTIQRDSAWVAAATPEEVDRAFNAGELDKSLGRGAFYEPRKPEPQSDAEYAAQLGITVEEFGHIERPDVLAKIMAHSSEATGHN